MICIFAFFVFAFLAIFSATYRPLAKEAFECVFRRITLRPCDTALDQRIKAHIIGKIMKHSHRLAKFTFRYFEILSWILVILTIASMVYSAYGGYNYYRYGNCYGPESTAFCPFTLLEGEQTSGISANYTGPIIYPDKGNDLVIGPSDAKVTIIEFGCYLCPYTREAEPTVKQVLAKYKDRIQYVYRDFPLGEKHTGAFLHAEAAQCAKEQGKFWEMHDKLFELPVACGTAEADINTLKNISIQLGLDAKKFADCLDSKKYESAILEDFDAGIKAKITGTPTFFINNHTIVGPRPLAAFEKVIDEQLAK